jgi:UDP-GlcNAc3NAcA epimerase
MRIATIVGTRPQLIKAAALGPALRARHNEILVDTGQHWDDEMAGAFFSELNLPRPNYSLGMGGSTSAEQIGGMVPAIARVLSTEGPDAVLVYGDTNSTLAGALAGATVGVPVAHVEAGLRSFDRRMPEELNRVLVDHVAQWLFAPTPTAVANLENEGIRAGVVLVGDVMQDLAAHVVPQLRHPRIIERVAGRLVPGQYVFATIHRAENRVPSAVAAWAGLMNSIARSDRPVVLALHPGTRAAMAPMGVTFSRDVRIIQPQPYRTTMGLQLHAAAVVTDSGGIQREAGWLGVPCIVLRTSTEWVEAVADSRGGMVVVGRNVDAAARAVERLAPRNNARSFAAERAATVRVEESGAAAAIARDLDGATTGR